MTKRSANTSSSISIAKKANKLTDLASTPHGTVVTGVVGSVLSDVYEQGTEVDPIETIKNAMTAGAQSAATVGTEWLLDKGITEASKHLAKESGKALAKESGKALAKESVMAAAKNTLRGNAVGAAAGLLVDQGVDTFRLLTGEIDGREYGHRSAENVSSSGGSLGGSALGAMIGTALCPGPGTAVGGFIGGVLGGSGGKSLINKLFRRR